MERFKSLNYYQKGIIVVMIVMALIFTVIYPMTISRVGYRYNDAILVPSQENGATVYSGKVNGELTQFIVSEENSIMLQYGNKSYGPYTIKEDPTAIPKDEESAKQMIGVEIYNNDKVMFRGGILDASEDYWLYDESYWLYNEDGTLYNFGFAYTSGDEIDEIEHSASTIYELLNDPELTHNGDALAWLGAVVICILNALSILFADELFKLNLIFHIRNAEKAEPSDWEIAVRYISWTVIAIMALVIFVTGLQ